MTTRPKPAPPASGPGSPLAALRTAYPTWRIEQAPDGRWIAALASRSIPLEQLLAGAYTAIKAKTLPALAAGIRDLHRERWGATA